MRAPQRTLSRRGFDPGSKPLPILFQVYELNRVGPNTLRLTFLQPVILRGVPAVLAGINPPVSASAFDALNVDLVYTGPIDQSQLFTVPDWSLQIRGENGEYLSGGIYRSGSGDAGSLTPLVSVIGVAVSAGNMFRVVLSGDCPGLTMGGFSLSGLAILDVMEVSPSEYDLEAEDPPGGVPWTVATYGPGMQGTNNVWVAPGQGIVQ